jgi:hypothetical protein
LAVKAKEQLRLRKAVLPNAVIVEEREKRKKESASNLYKIRASYS